MRYIDSLYYVRNPRWMPVRLPVMNQGYLNLAKVIDDYFRHQTTIPGPTSHISSYVRKYCTTNGRPQSHPACPPSRDPRPSPPSAHQHRRLQRPLLHLPSPPRRLLFRPTATHSSTGRSILPSFLSSRPVFPRRLNSEANRPLGASERGEHI